MPPAAATALNAWRWRRLTSDMVPGSFQEATISRLEQTRPHKATIEQAPAQILTAQQRNIDRDHDH
jgi:hypothetical protein